MVTTLLPNPQEDKQNLSLFCRCFDELRRSKLKTFVVTVNSQTKFDYGSLKDLALTYRSASDLITISSAGLVKL